jgi:hypothetical protein
LIQRIIAHKEPGIGMVGAGLLQAPMACFEKAFEAFATMAAQERNYVNE